MLRGYKRNQQLIDLNFIPKNIYNQAIEQFVNYKCNDRSLMFNYFIDKKLKNLMFLKIVLQKKSVCKYKFSKH